MEGISSLQERSQLTFLALTSSPELRFAAYGGFLLLDDQDRVVDIHSVEQGPNSHMSLGFSEPRPWRAEFTKQLDDAGRFQPVTLPELLRAGATQFCWLSPGEVLTVGPENWVPASSGGFLYKRGNDLPPIYFPVEYGVSENDIHVTDVMKRPRRPRVGCCMQ